MPLTSDAFSRINRYDTAAPPLHRQVADVIRQAIIDGTLSPGEQLPSEHAMAFSAGVTRGTVRDGIDDLVNEGLVIKRSGRPTRVVSPPQVRRMSTQRYQEALDAIRAHDGVHPLSSAFTADHGVEWTEHNVLAAYEEAVPTPGEAQRLALPPDPIAPSVLRRRLIKQVRDVTVQLQTSVMPLDLVAGTPVADPNRQPWPGGTLAELYSIGLVVTRVYEEARVRAPTAEERKILGLEAAGPVSQIVRVFYVKQRPVECSMAVVDATSYVLSFETELR